MNEMKENISVIVRRATLQDLDVIVPLFDAYRQFYRQPSDLGVARSFLAERLKHDESIIFMALGDDDVALGLMQLFPCFSSAAAARIFILNDLFVVPEVRRRGVGALLLRTAAEFSRSRGAVRLTLSTEVTNASARTLYAAHGWTLQTDFCVYNLPLS